MRHLSGHAGRRFCGICAAALLAALPSGICRAAGGDPATAGSTAAAQVVSVSTALCGGLYADMVSSSEAVRQSGLERAAALSGAGKDELSSCLARGLDRKIQPDAQSRILAAQALDRLGAAQPRRAELWEMFRSASAAEEAAAAAAALSPFVAQYPEYAAPLGKIFASGDNTANRLIAAWLLTRMGPAARGAQDKISPLLKDADPRLRGWTAAALAFMFPEKPEKTSARDIAGLFRYDEQTARAALEQLDPEGKKTAALLRPALSDPDPQLRAVCALVLGEMGEKAAEAVPDLMKMLESPDGKTAYAAAQALGGIGVPALEPLFECLGGESSAVRQCAAALAWMGGPAVDRLQRALASKSPSARTGGCEALGMMADHLLMPQAAMFYADPQSSFDRLRKVLPVLQKVAETETDEAARLSCLRAVEAIKKGL
ncbi:MAG: HEAT repeat domain-containing protein [Elusimicrobiales bacterium]